MYAEKWEFKDAQQLNFILTSASFHYLLKNQSKQLQEVAEGKAFLIRGNLPLKSDVCIFKKIIEIH